MGLFVIVLLSIATVLLIRNMNKRLRRLPDSFPDAQQTQREAEIARVNAGVERSDVEPLRLDSDQNRSSEDQVAAETEVKGDTTESHKVVADGDQGRV